MANNVRFVDSLKVGQYKGSAGTPGTDFSGSFTGSFTGSFEGSGDLTGSFTGSFTGDGSGLTNLPISDPFPFTGSAQITGSLGVTGSVEATNFTGSSFTGSFVGDGSSLTNLPIGSGSWDGIFSGSAQITGSLGVTGSINATNFTGSSFTGSFVGDGSSLTNLPIGSGSWDGIFSGSAQITGSLGVTGSINATNFTGSSFTGSFVGDGSGLTTLKATETDLQQSITSNQTVGGVSSGEVFNPGTDVEDILRQILISYIEPTISNLYIKNNNVEISYIRDVGDDFITDEVTFNATQDNPNGNFPKNSELVITNATIGNGTITGPTTLASSNFITITDRTINKTTDGTVTFRVNTESQTTSDTQTTTKSINFRWRNYLLATGIVIDNNTKLETAFSNNTVQSPLDTDISWDATCNSDNENTNNFTYIVYPSSYGDLTSIIQSGATPVLGAFTKLTDITANNSSGISQTWRIYKSNIPGAFASGVILTIS